MLEDFHDVAAALPGRTRAADARRRITQAAGRYAIGILSNWPFAATIDRYVDAMGWAPWVRAIVVSQRVGVIKPHGEIFAVAREALGGPPPDAILHVGDDWAADIVGAAAAGWRVAFVNHRPRDSPLPSSERDYSEDESDRPRERIGRFCDEHHILFVDVVELWRKLPTIDDAARMISDASRHYNASGNRFVAEAIYRRLQGQRLLRYPATQHAEIDSDEVSR